MMVLSGYATRRALPSPSRVREVLSAIPISPQRIPYGATPRQILRGYAFASAYLAQWGAGGYTQTRALSSFDGCGCQWWDLGCNAACDATAVGKAVQQAGADVGRAAADAAKATNDFLKSIDPTTDAGRKKIASIFPWPLDKMIADSGKLLECLHGKDFRKDPASVALCIGQFLIDVLLDIILDPHFQVILAVAQGNLPLALQVAAKIVAKDFSEKLHTPEFRAALHLSVDDANNLAALIVVLLNSGDLLAAIFQSGAKVFSMVSFYYVLAGTLIAGADEAPFLYDLGDAIAYNAALLAAVFTHGPTSPEAKAQFNKKWVEPVAAGIAKLDPRQIKSFQQAADMLASLGVTLNQIGRGIQKIPAIGPIAGSGIADAGKNLNRLGVDLRKNTSSAAELQAHPPPQLVPPDVSEKLRAARAAQDEAMRKQDSALARVRQLEAQLAEKGRTPPPLPPAAPARTPAMVPAAPLQAGAVRPGIPVPLRLAPAAKSSTATLAAAAGAGFLVGGPIGAAAGLVVSSFLSRPSGPDAGRKS